MKEEHTGKITQGELGYLSTETMEQDLDVRPTSDIGGKFLNNLENGDEKYSGRDEGDVPQSPRNPLRATRGQASDSVSVVDGTGQVLVDGFTGQTASGAATSEDDLSPQTMEKWALDNAPPPIKVRREGETSEESSPKELSPPPSPKRMRELARKGAIHDLPFSKVFSQGSV